MITLTKVSGLTGKTNTMDLPISSVDYYKWLHEDGGLVQNVFPQLTAAEREFMITGSTSEEWDMLFGADDQEEYTES